MNKLNVPSKVIIEMIERDGYFDIKTTTYGKVTMYEVVGLLTVHIDSLVKESQLRGKLAAEKYLMCNKSEAHGSEAL